MGNPLIHTASTGLDIATALIMIPAVLAFGASCFMPRHSPWQPRLASLGLAFFALALVVHYLGLA